jgi:hypothetical protein
MSQRNGDKARFGREQQRKIRLRQNTREVRMALEAQAAIAARPVPSSSPSQVIAGQAGPAGQ